MREVLISIQPKWVEKICRKEKTVEVRKTRPKLETPFKCYIYCTMPKNKHDNLVLTPFGYDVGSEGAYCNYAGNSNGKVIGEFVCDRIIGTCPWRLKGETGLCAKRTEEETNLPKNACLTLEEIEKYAGSRGREIYGWHITDLIVYDEPRELSEFKRVCDGNCQECKYAIWETQGWYHEPKIVDCKSIAPPQSWCYVEDTE